MSKKKLKQPEVDLEKWANELFDDHSDRAAVLVGAAYIDDLLKKILERNFRPSPSGDEDLLNPERPLSTFSARIRIAYRLKLIDQNLAEALHLLRELRNGYAHWPTAGQLDEPHYGQLIEQLLSKFDDVALIAVFARGLKSAPRNGVLLRLMIYCLTDVLEDELEASRCPIVIWDTPTMREHLEDVRTQIKARLTVKNK